MKQNRIVTLIFLIMDMMLAVVCGILYFRVDREAPKFEFGSGETAGGESADMPLLSGVTAFDDRDGDVTGRIVIEKVIEDEKGGFLVVFYAVSDKAGNVAEASRRLPSGKKEQEAVSANMFDSSGNGRDGKDETGANVPAGGEDAAEAGEENGGDAAEAEAEVGAEDGGNAAEAGAEDDGNAAEAGEEAEAEASGNAAEAGAENERNAREAGTEDGGNAGKAGAENERNAQEVAAQEVAAQEVAAENGGASPALSLRQQEVTTPAGIAPAWVTVIGALTDDKDGYETLFRNLTVSKYDVNTPGTYSVTLTTEDSDGNKSRPVPLTIIVEESR